MDAEEKEGEEGEEGEAKHHKPAPTFLEIFGSWAAGSNPKVVEEEKTKQMMIQLEIEREKSRQEEMKV
jgi:hypothetical protein